MWDSIHFCVSRSKYSEQLACWVLLRVLSAWSVQFSSVTHSCLTLCDTMDFSRPGFPVHHQLLELTQTHVHQSVMSSTHPILCRPLILQPSIFPSNKVFSNESVLLIRWPKYWSFSFSISSSNEYLGLISFRTDRFELLAVQGTLKNGDKNHKIISIDAEKAFNNI